MTRKLKFRAWDIKNKRWIQVSDIDIDVYGGIKRVGGIAVIDGMMEYVKLENYFPDDPDFILVQYTNRKDKNNEEIYDESIVETQYAGNNIRWKCVFNNGCFELVNLSNSDWKSMLAGHHSSHLEVLGSIRENPELLEEK